MAKAKKLPSGQWRTLAYSHTDSDGKRHYESFTADTKKESEYQAAEFSYTKKNRKKEAKKSISFGEALDKYIELRSAILSPATIREYSRIRKHDLQGIMEIKLPDLTQEDIQTEINKEALSHSPKTVRNLHGIISTVLAVYRPDFKLSTTLPQKVRPSLHIPTESEVRILMDAIVGTRLEIPVLLAAFGPMRCGEICALDSDHIDGNMVHVEFSLAKDKDGNWVKKTTKSFSGNRFITYPDFVIDKIKGIEGRIVDTNPARLSNMFTQRMKRTKLDIERFRFHDLRHYSASIMHAIGIPDQYIMERGGWATDTTLKKVYRHALQDKDQEMIIKANDYFSSYATQNTTQGK